MDFTKVEICNPNSISIARFSNIDANDPSFDSDNDLLFSKNGLVITFPTPVTEYKWLEIELVNTGNAVVNLNIAAYADGPTGSTVQKANCNVAGLNQYAQSKIKIPNIGRLERITFSAGTIQTGEYIAIKNIRVVLSSDQYNLVTSDAVVATIPGWTYDVVNDWYYKDFVGGEPTYSIATAFAKTADYLNVKIWNLIDDSFLVSGFNIEGKTVSFTGHNVEMDFSGDPLKQVFPCNLPIIGPAVGGRIYLKFKYGSFPTVAPSAFSGLIAPIAAALLAVPYNILNANNIWNGTNTYNGQSTFVGQVSLPVAGVSWGVPNGYAKVVAGALLTVASIGVADIAGAGNIITHNVAEFFQVANNLSEGVPATMRGNLGLGTMATQNANAVAITGGAIDGTPVGATTSSTGKFSTVAIAGTLTADSLLSLGNLTNHPSAATTIIGNATQIKAPSTATSALYGDFSRLDTIAAAYTLAVINHYYAAITTKGAGSTISQVRGFYAANGIANGSTNYGFYSDIANASNTYQFAMVGTAPSYFSAPLGVGAAPQSGVMLDLNGAHPSSVNSIYSINVSQVAPSTATATFEGFRSGGTTATAAFTLTQLIHFYAIGQAKGVGSTITSAFGFRAANSLTIGTNNYGFYSDINSATGTWQSFMVGTAPSFFGGAIAIFNGDITQIAVIKMGQSSLHPGTATNVYGAYLHMVIPATATSTFVSFDSNNIATAAAAFTCANVVHFRAAGNSIGAGSAVGISYGFFASNSIAVGGTNYGYYSNINSATNTFQLAMLGTGQSQFNGAVTIGNASNAFGALIIAGLPASVTDANPFWFKSFGSGTSSHTGVNSSFLSTFTSATAAYTVGALHHFEAQGAAAGAGSTITTVRGFYAQNSIAVGTTNYGFYSAINSGTTNYQMVLAGTAPSYITGALGVGTSNSAPTQTPAFFLNLGGGGTHFSTANQLNSVQSAYVVPSTGTNTANGFTSSITTAAAAFTLIDLNLFNATTVSKGATSSITNIYGFRVNNAIAVGTNNYGFWSDIASAANTFGLSIQGSAASRFGGPVYHAQDGNTTQATSALFQGTGVPNNANGNNGDFYLRGDTPGTANQRLYVKSAGAWVGIV